MEHEMEQENDKTAEIELWRKQSEAWRLSGLSQLEFCESHGINFNQFCYQHKRVKRIDNTGKLKFVGIKSKALESQASVGIQMMLPNGVRVGVGHDVNADLLKMVLSVAGDLRC